MVQVCGLPVMILRASHLSVIVVLKPSCLTAVPGCCRHSGASGIAATRSSSRPFGRVLGSGLQPMNVRGFSTTTCVPRRTQLEGCAMMNVPARAFTRLAVAHYFEDWITTANAATGCTGSYRPIQARGATQHYFGASSGRAFTLCACICALSRVTEIINMIVLVRMELACHTSGSCYGLTARHV